jgi:DNA-directed RNA polymerase subunit RPC12/RpoP
VNTEHMTAFAYLFLRTRFRMDQMAGTLTSVVYLPKCHICGSTMRLVRVHESEQRRTRVLQCKSCNAEIIWRPPADDDPSNKFLAAIFPPTAEEAV